MIARQEQATKELTYRIYISDALQTIAENTARFAGGKILKDRYADIIIPRKEDTRSGNEIAADVISRAGLMLGKEAGP